MAKILIQLYPFLSFAVWFVALFGFDFLAKDLTKKKKVIATIILIISFLAWFEGSRFYDQNNRKIASQRLVNNLQDEGLLPYGDYSAYYDIDVDIDLD